jgi:hypothetical protein
MALMTIIPPLLKYCGSDCMKLYGLLNSNRRPLLTPIGGSVILVFDWLYDVF